MKVEEFLKEYESKMIVKEDDERTIVGLPFFHLGHLEGIALKFSRDDGKLVVSDCRTTAEYLDANGVDLDDYPERLKKIMSKFDIFLEGNVFRKIIYNADSYPDLCRGIGYFIEALSLIAHIDL